MYSIHTTVMQYLGGYECVARVYHYESLEDGAELVLKRRAFLDHNMDGYLGILQGLADALDRYSNQLCIGPERLTEDELSDS